MNALLLLSLIARADDHTALVGFETDADEQALHAYAEAHGGSAHGCFHAARVCALHFPGAPPLAELGARPGVRYVEQDALIPLADESDLQEAPHGLAPPPGFSDSKGTSDCSDLWELDTLRADEVWLSVTGSGADPVAIADSGFLQTHEELVGHIHGGYDYGDGDSDPEVVWSAGVPGHGTFIGGMIAADGDNGVGRAGLMPEGQLELLKIADSSGALYWSYAIDALSDLASSGTSRVLSYSLSSSSSTSAFSDSVDALGAADILLVAAAANCSTAYCSDADNDRYPVYPANQTGDHILSVAGTMPDDTFNPYSHYGADTVDLAAPGDSLCSLDIGSDDDYAVASGTSYATPLVAAAGGLLFEAYPSLTAPEVARILRASVEQLSSLSTRTISGGRLDPAAALLTPMPHIDEPDDLSVNETATLKLSMDNVAGSGTGYVILVHDPMIEVISAVDSSSQSWVATRTEPGDSVTLEDAGSVRSSTEAITVLQSELTRNTPFDLSIKVESHELGKTNASVRFLTTGDGWQPLGAPYGEGSDDATGESAWSFQFNTTVAVEEPEDTGVLDDTDTPDDTHEPVDTDPGNIDTDDSTGTPHDSGKVKDTGDSKTTSCACANGGGPAGWGALFALALVWLPRRRRTISQDRK